MKKPIKIAYNLTVIKGNDQKATLSDVLFMDSESFGDNGTELTIKIDKNLKIQEVALKPILAEAK